MAAFKELWATPLWEEKGESGEGGFGSRGGCGVFKTFLLNAWCEKATRGFQVFCHPNKHLLILLFHKLFEVPLSGANSYQVKAEN